MGKVLRGDGTTQQGSGPIEVVNAVNYTAITTAGTTTVASNGGVFYGLNVVSIGTAFTAVSYDIQGTTTNNIVGISTAAALGVLGGAAPAGVGVRFTGSLVVVTAGTAGQYNALWD